MSRNINDAHPILIEAYTYAKDVFNKKYTGKYCIKLSCVHRNVEEQQILYAQGRTTAGKIVTNIDGINKKSKHNYLPSKAIDVYVLDLKTREADWYSINLYREFAVYMKEQNPTLIWGGDWTSIKDYPHFEI